MSERLIQITRCMNEINLCVADQKPGCLGALLGEMDWLEELHYWLYQAS